MKFEKRNAAGTPEPQEEKNSQDGNKPVVVYIMILFIAAFLLMALSFFMHQRSNTEALGELQHSVSTMQEIQANQEKIIDLQDRLAVTEDELDDTKAKLETYQEEQEAARKALELENQAMRALYTLQQQYLTLNIEGCAKTIEDAEAAGLTAALSDKSEGGVTSPAVRWQQLKDAVDAKLADENS